MPFVLVTFRVANNFAEARSGWQDADTFQAGLHMHGRSWPMLRMIAPEQMLRLCGL